MQAMEVDKKNRAGSKNIDGVGILAYTTNRVRSKKGVCRFIGCFIVTQNSEIFYRKIKWHCRRSLVHEKKFLRIIHRRLAERSLAILEILWKSMAISLSLAYNKIEEKNHGRNKK